MPPSPLTRIRRLCKALPDSHEVMAWGEPTFRVRNKVFAMYAHPNTHGGGQSAVWIKSDPTSQQFLIKRDPKRYFSPPYVGPGGWVGVRLDGRVNWKDVHALLQGAHEMTAPKPKAARRRSATKS